MSEKQKNDSANGKNKKTRTHNLHTIETKMEIIRRSENGESFASIGRSYNINRSTICSILKNKNKIKDYVENCGNVSLKIVSKRHSIVIDEMERSLSRWIRDQRQKDIPLSFSIIRAKALSLHEYWKARIEEDSNTEFLASKGWFEKFKMRYPLDSTCLDVEFTESYSDPLSDKDLIEIESESEEDAEIVDTLTIENMNKAFKHLDRFLTIIDECDSNTERVSKVRKAIERGTACYRTVYMEKKMKTGCSTNSP